jgi:putative endonuclease
MAANHLAGCGYRILERNYRTRAGELDLVAASRSSLVFCEVKTRVADSARGPAGPLESIGPAKRRRLRRMASEWLSECAPRAGPAPGEIRFDAIGVTVTAGGRLLALDHVEAAF